jgi:hypothetical protein
MALKKQRPLCEITMCPRRHFITNRWALPADTMAYLLDRIYKHEPSLNSRAGLVGEINGAE